jgi:ADP-heptose:LPS heptosyltransferase
MKFIKKLCRCLIFNRQLKRLKKEIKPKVLVTWNRGLGDIPLGLYALLYRIREWAPTADVTFLTRADLREGMYLLPDVSVWVAADWKRGQAFNLTQTLSELQSKIEDFDLVLENPDPTRWLKWQLGALTPKLKWNPEWDCLCERFQLSPRCVGVHVQTETVYGYEKNWPLDRWNELFRQLTEEKGMQVLLFGFKKEPFFNYKGVIDLRGETSLYEMLSIIKSKCSYLVVPDSGILSITYYLDLNFSLRVVSLWADPRQGVLKQNVPSPNLSYSHSPLLGKKENVANISVEEVMQELFC